MIQIENDGPELIWTNYWDTEHAKAGYVYLTTNAGCFRLLAPPGKGLSLDEMREASEVIITRAPWPEMGKHDALEIMFEDGSNSPYCLHIVSEQVDRMPLDSDRDRPGEPPRWKLAVYNQDGKQVELPARYRRAKKLPYLKAWKS